MFVSLETVSCSNGVSQLRGKAVHQCHRTTSFSHLESEFILEKPFVRLQPSQTIKDNQVQTAQMPSGSISAVMCVDWNV
jgi:hypothetical protein